MSYYVSFLLLFLSIGAAALAHTRVVILGDSLTTGLGVEAEEAFPHRLQELLRAKGKEVIIINAGISGSTSSSGLVRLRWLMRSHPDIVILSLGANDGLRGKPVKVMVDNLTAMIQYAQQEGAKVLLTGMKLPFSYGNEYRQHYETAFRDLAKTYKVPFIPFLLEGVAGVRELNLADGVHPNAKGHAAIAQHVMEYLEPML